MTKPSSDDRYSDEETAQRRDEVIKRMLKTPPQPRRTNFRTDKAKENRPQKERSHRAKPEG